MKLATFFELRNTPTSWRDYGVSLGVGGVCTGLCFALFPFFALTNLVMVYLLGVMVVAARGRRGPAALASLLSVLAFDYFFVPPRWTLAVSNAEYLWTFLVMFLVAMTISHLTIRLRCEVESVKESERRTALMHAFTEKLSGFRGWENILGSAVSHVAEVFHAEVSAYIPDPSGRLQPFNESPVPPEAGDKGRGVAQWVFDRGESAGLGTTTLHDEEALYLPLQGGAGTVGVLRVRPHLRETLLVAESRMLLSSYSHQVALALEVGRLDENARRAELEAETQRLRSGLLSAVSHDFRTPLAAILGSASALLQREDLRGSTVVREQLENIQSEADRLSHLVRNLLEATRLESGVVRLRKELYPLEEVLGSALDRLEKLLKNRKLRVNIPEDFPPIPMDGTLVEQVFINLLENALLHTAPETPIEVSAEHEGNCVRVDVADRGPGIAPDNRKRVFEKFYHGAASPGAGLGLAICQAIVKAHGGRIWVEDRLDGGAIFRFILPLNDSLKGSSSSG